MTFTDNQMDWLKREVQELKDETEDLEDSLQYIKDLAIQFCDEFPGNFDNLDEIKTKVEELIRG